MRFPPEKQAIEQDGHDADTDGAVGDIEGRPMP
jgi:hypothetical protein